VGLGFGAVCGQVKHGVALSAGLGSAEIGMGTGYVGKRTLIFTPTPAQVPKLQAPICHPTF